MSCCQFYWWFGPTLLENSDASILFGKNKVDFSCYIMRHSSRVPNGCNGLLIPLSSANYADAFSLSSFYIFITEINPAHPQDVVSIDKTSTCRGHWWTPLAVLPVNDSEITNWPTSAAGELGARYLQEKPPDRKVKEVRTRSSCMWEYLWWYGWYRPINWRYKLSDLDLYSRLGAKHL